MILEISIIGIVVLNCALLFLYSNVKEINFVIIFSLLMCLLYMIVVIRKSLKSYSLKKCRIKINRKAFRYNELQKQREVFINILKHDLKTPVVAQIRSLNMLLNGFFGSLKPEQKEMLELTKESCEDILKMLSSVLITYKFKNNEILLRNDFFNLKNIIKTSCVELEPLFRNKNLTLLSTYPKESSFIRGDKVLLLQAINSIIENSITYSFNDSIFQVSIQNLDDKVCISVVNKGNHLSDSERAQMFDYASLNSIKNNKIGFSVQLCLAMQIIKAHNGEIVVRNQGHDEVIFDIIIPLAKTVTSIFEIKKYLVCDKNLRA